MITESNRMESTPLQVGLVPAAAADLEAEKAASKMSGADVTNRALQLYHFLMEQERHGAEICVRPRRRWRRPVTPVKVVDIADE